MWDLEQVQRRGRRIATPKSTPLVQLYSIRRHGTMPLEYEIKKIILNYWHRMIKKTNDPVESMYENMKLLAGEKK